LDGLTVTTMFLKGTLDKAGVTPNFDHVGQYKSAIEEYTRTGMSPPAREAMGMVLDDFYRLLVDSLASARGFTTAESRRLIEQGPYRAREALERGLLDTLLYD